MVMTGQISAEQPEGRRPARRTPSRQESAESQQDPGGQKSVDFKEPDTLLGTALSSQDGNNGQDTIRQRGNRAAELAANIRQESTD